MNSWGASVQIGLSTAHDGQISTEKKLLLRDYKKLDSFHKIIESEISFNVSVSEAGFQHAKPTTLSFKLCVLLMLQNVSNSICIHTAQLNVQRISSP